MSAEIYILTRVKTSVSPLSACLTLVEDLPAAAAHDKEPRVGVPLSEEEEGVPALAGGSAKSGLV